VEAMVMKEWLTIKRDLDSLVVRGGRRKTERFACRFNSHNWSTRIAIVLLQTRSQLKQ
jgi:hypothetical protein